MKSLILAAFLFLSTNAYCTQVAITMDDPGMESAGDYTPFKINQAILATLEKNKLKAALFICGKRIDSPNGKDLLKAWDQGGHLLGSHSYSHLNLHDDKTTSQQYIADIERNLPLIDNLKNFHKFFRFPFLKEGNTSEKRDAVRKYLADHHFRNGYVTVDTSDWAISARLKNAIKKGRKDLTPYRRYYINHMLDRLKYYDDLATKTVGRPIKHTMLIHHNVLNALFLDDLIQAFKEKGVHFISAAEAYTDSVFLETPNFLPAGESLIWMLAKIKNPILVDERYPAEDGSYIDSEMDKLGL